MPLLLLHNTARSLTMARGSEKSHLSFLRILHRSMAKLRWINFCAAIILLAGYSFSSSQSLGNWNFEMIDLKNN